jgi:hypothetical protein
MTNFNSTDDKFYQEYLERNTEYGVAQLEIAIKELEAKEEYEHCSYLAKQIEMYYDKQK